MQAFSKDIEVPLEDCYRKHYDISITLDEVKNIDSNIYIKDKVTGISHEITRR